METKKLAVLLEAVEMKSINKAAKKLDYSQSGLMYMLNALESEIGITILKRTHQGIVFTAAGKELEPFLRNLVDCENALYEKVRELNETTKIRFASYPSIATNWLPEVINEFRKEAQGIEIELRIGVSEIPKWLDSNEIDFALAERSFADENKWIPIWDDLMYAVVPSISPLAAETTISLEKLIEDQFILFPSINVKNTVGLMLEERNIKIKNKMEVSTVDATTLLAMVGQGLGVTFLSKLYASECPETVRMIPLDPPLIRPLGIVMKPGKFSSVVIKKFIETLIEHNSPE